MWGKNSSGQRGSSWFRSKDFIFSKIKVLRMPITYVFKGGAMRRDTPYKRFASRFFTWNLGFVYVIEIA
ncbi:hypothetical protein L1987_12323 [Smallanthus sonchifolius]|uniref:Uncharacterized protein n=1 Tax=Smallanthus sonchifolius TaxID=185202 RepID=A0ACB9JDG2_9ASTR|nr:hypothetical protein L1987_12323 [Smallanthus sonchifolius]